MKKSGKLVLWLVLVMLFYPLSQVLAQNYVFKVLASSGENMLKKEGGWEPVKIGSQLNENQSLKVVEGAYLGLVHQTGRTMAIDQAGTYKINALAAEFNSSQKSIAGKYAEFVINKMAGQDKGQSTNVTGAVERSTDASNLKLLLPNTVDVHGKEVILRWNELETEDGYKVTLKNMFDEVIKTDRIQQNRYKLDFTENALAKADRLIVSVETLGADNIKSNNYLINKLDKQKAGPIDQELNTLRSEINNPDESALDQLLLASFYEQNNLLVDALTHYEMAINISPDVEAFKSAYQQFIVRNNLGN